MPQTKLKAGDSVNYFGPGAKDPLEGKILEIAEDGSLVLAIKAAPPESHWWTEHNVTNESIDGGKHFSLRA